MKKIILVCFMFFFGYEVSSEELNIINKESPLTIEADYIEYDQIEEKINAEGNITFEGNDLKLFTNSILLDLKENNLQAKEKIIIENKDRKIEGENFFYNFNEKIGEINNAKTEIENIFISGDKIHFSKEKTTVNSANLTPCVERNPHYHLGADYVEIIPKNKIRVRKIKFFLGEKRIFTWPRASFRLPQEAKKKEGFPLPAFGVSTKEYVFLRWNYLHSLFKDVYLMISLNPSLRYGFQGEARLQREDENYKTYLVAGKSIETRTSLPDYQVIRLPEFVIIKKQKKLPKSSFLYSVEGGWGRIYENESKEDRERKFYQISLNNKPIQFKKFQIYLNSSLRKSYYTNFGEFRDLRGDVSFCRKDFKISYIHHILGGNTPFYFDRVELERELDTEVKFKINKNFSFNLKSIFDLSNYMHYDNIYTLGFNVDCFSLHLSYLQRRAETKLSWQSGFLYNLRWW